MLVSLWPGTTFLLGADNLEGVVIPETAAWLHQTRCLVGCSRGPPLPVINSLNATSNVFVLRMSARYEALDKLSYRVILKL